MRNFAVVIFAATLLCGGCAWFGFGDDSSTTAISENEQPKPEEIKAAADAKKDVAVQSSANNTKTPAKTETTQAKVAQTAQAKNTTVKGKKTEAQIKAELDQMGKKLASQSARTLLPNKANKEVKKSGANWVATYIEVDPTNVTTEMRPGANGQYVGFIRYQEHIMECVGKTRAEALSATCVEARTRNLNELIRYDGKEWQD